MKASLAVVAATLTLTACQPEPTPKMKLLIVGRGTATVIDYANEARCTVAAQRLTRQFEFEAVNERRAPEMRAYCIPAN